MKNKVFKTIMSTFLAMLMLMSVATPVFAITVDGTGYSSSGTSTHASGAYVLPMTSNDGRSNAYVGMRFSVYNTNSGYTYGTIDVFRNTCKDGRCYIGYEKFNDKLNKHQYQENNSYLNMSFSTSQTTDSCYRESDFSSMRALPTDCADMESWEQDKGNFTSVLYTICNNSDIDSLPNGAKVIDEPLYAITVNGTS